MVQCLPRMCETHLQQKIKAKASLVYRTGQPGLHRNLVWKNKTAATNNKKPKPNSNTCVRIQEMEAGRSEQGHTVDQGQTRPILKGKPESGYAGHKPVHHWAGTESLQGE